MKNELFAKKPPGIKPKRNLNLKMPGSFTACLGWALKWLGVSVLLIDLAAGGISIWAFLNNGVSLDGCWEVAAAWFSIAGAGICISFFGHKLQNGVPNRDANASSIVLEKVVVIVQLFPRSDKPEPKQDALPGFEDLEDAEDNDRA